MHFTDLYHKIMALGWWGLVLAALLVLQAVAATFILQRRTVGKTGDQKINRAQIAMGFLSTILLLISGLWSGWAKFHDYVESDPGKAWAVAAGFIICGLVLSIILQQCAVMAIRERHGSRWVAVMTMLAFSTIWLGISPLQNARFLCAQETIRSEIELRFSQLDHHAGPIIDQYSFYRRKIIPNLAAIHEALVRMKEEQSREELGGCGPICRQYEYYANLLLPMVNRLYTTYDPDDSEKNLRESTRKVRNEISVLLNGHDYTPEEMRLSFFRLASAWLEILHTARSAESPMLPLQQAMGSLSSLLEFLHTYQDRHADNQIRMLAVNKAISTLEPLINDLKMAFRSERQASSSIQPVIFREPNTEFGFNLAAIASIRMNTELMRKHLGRIWPEALLAFFIDIAGMAFIYVPMLVILFRGRPVQRAMEVVRRRQLAIRQAQYRLDIHEKECLQLDKESLETHEKHERNLAGLADKRRKALAKVRKSFELKQSSLSKRKQKLVAKMEADLSKIAKEEQVALKKAISAGDEVRIRGRHEVYRDNIRAGYQQELEHLTVKEKDLARESGAKIAELSSNFSRQEQECKAKFVRKEKALAGRAATYQHKKAKFETALEHARQQVEDAENRLAEARGESSTPNKNHL